MIMMRLDGRLGNNLFQYATVRSVAEKNGYEFALTGNGIDTGVMGLFDLDYGVISQSPAYAFHDNHCYNPLVWEIPDFTLMTGYYQSEKYFDEAKVRQWFTPKFSVDSDPAVCYIHFRGGDYNIPPWNSYQLPNSYYQEAMDRMRLINENLRFVVVTDDIYEAVIRFPDLDIISNAKEHDFVLLYQAKYLIISNSSYSWWTAWLNTDNIVIAPQGWNLYNIDKSDFSPKDIKVDRWIWI